MAHISFLFVINELAICMEPDDGGIVPSHDDWGNVVPPTDPRAYHGETPSPVLRYRDGVVEKAPHYVWYRQGGWGFPGDIYAADPEGVPYLDRQRPSPYRTSTVFACTPHLPLVVAETDASLGGTAIGHAGGIPWCLLHFDHGQGPLRGLSHAVGEARGSSYVAGHRASWIPSLVPSTFKNPHHGASASIGLGGDLSVVLALMAFSEPVEERHSTRIRRLFLSRDDPAYRNRRWRRDNAPRGYPPCTDTPKGFLVHVCCDDMESRHSTEAALFQFEFNEPFIRER